ncbi:MAG: alanine--tRNA ligase, partial [Ruthenibacterium sp.]
MTGAITVGDEVVAHIDEQRRKAITRNHTSCHLLQTALREVLGTHVHQSGSFVDENKCRFDFSHFSAMTQEEIVKTEELVNQLILDANGVTVKEMSILQAKELGAMALFGEKYGNQVRVCDVSGKSIELCGGTHVENTSNIGLFKITHETSVAAGIRRIEATTGYGVLHLFEQNTQVLTTIA